MHLRKDAVQNAVLERVRNRVREYFLPMLTFTLTHVRLDICMKNVFSRHRGAWDGQKASG